MAHKTAFNAQSLGTALATCGFAGSVVTRDRGFGLHAIATKSAWNDASIKHHIEALHPGEETVLEQFRFGCYTPSI